MPTFSFNSQQFDPRYSAAGGLPAGPNGENVDYKVIIKESAQEPTQKGGGQLVFTLECIEGPCRGQTQRDGLNLLNANPQAVQIANQQLSAYCHVLGKFQFQQTEELHNIPFIVTIGRQKSNPEYTEVKAVKDVNGNEPGKSGAGPQVQQSAPQAPAQAPQGFAPQSQAPQSGGWGQQGGQPGQAPQQAPAQAGWGQPQPQQAPAAQGWGAQPQPAQGQPAQGGWGNR